jgi:hypothetical protein
MDSEASTESSGSEASASGPQAVHACTFPGCPKTFTNRGNMSRHLLSHQPARYICPVDGCGQTFNRSDSRLQHLRKLHPDHVIQEAEPARVVPIVPAQPVTEQPAQPARKRARRAVPTAEEVPEQRVEEVVPEQRVEEEDVKEASPQQESSQEELSQQESPHEESPQEEKRYKCFNREITTSDLSQLTGGPSARLGGPICDVLLSMLQMESRTSPKDAPIILFNTLFYPKLCTYTEERVAMVELRAYLRGKSVFKSTLFIPVTHNNIWGLVVVRPSEERMTYYDSSLHSSEEGMEAMSRVYAYLAIEYEHRTGQKLGEWAMNIDTHVPIHDHDVDSGVYMCLIAQRVMQCVRKRQAVSFEGMSTDVHKVRSEWFHKVLIG